MKSNCIICNKDIELDVCCDGTNCGCMGMPIDPPVCSDKCYDTLMNNLDEYFPPIDKNNSIDIDGIF
jgi:hypothetical protein